MSRAYLRIDPRLYDKKVIQQGYSLALFASFVAVLCEAESQPERGRFRSERILRAVLDGAAEKHIAELVKRGDLVKLEDGRLYVDGWDEWQEGDWKVGERVRRIRDRSRPVTLAAVTPVTVETVTPDTVATVYTPSDGARLSVIDSGSGSGKRKSSSSSTGTGPPADEGPLLTRAQLDAWSSFGPEWDALKGAWLARGLKLPPSGSTDQEGSQRAVLYPIVDAFPSRIGAWVAGAPKGSSGRDVVAHVIREYRDATGSVDELLGTDGPTRAEAAEALGAILGRMAQ